MPIKLPLYPSCVDKYAICYESKKLSLSARIFSHLFNFVLISSQLIQYHKFKISEAGHSGT